jgi:hypothetical protein
VGKGDEGMQEWREEGEQKGRKIKKGGTGNAGLERGGRTEEKEKEKEEKEGEGEGRYWGIKNRRWRRKEGKRKKRMRGGR